MLRQAENKVRIEGILAETDLKYVTYNKNINGVPTPVDAISGTIKILVDTLIDNKPTTLEVPVSMFANKITAKGTPNPAFTSIETAMNEFVSIKACGSKESADKVRITGGDLRINDFIGMNGEVVSQLRVNASFISKAVGEFKPEASFILEFMVGSKHRVVDADGVELDPAKLELNVIVPQYGGRVDVMKLYATNNDIINGLESCWEDGGCYKAAGILNFSSTTKEIIENMGIGGPIKSTRTYSIHELIINQGTDTSSDAFSAEDIKTAMNERNVRIEALKEKKLQKTVTTAPTADSALDLKGFGF